MSVTSGSILGDGITPAAADILSSILVTDPLNADLQWSEGSYRGFYTLTITTTTANATYYAMKDVKTQNLAAFASATFIVHAGQSSPWMRLSSWYSSVLQEQTNLVALSLEVKSELAF